MTVQDEQVMRQVMMAPNIVSAATECCTKHGNVVQHTINFVMLDHDDDGDAVCVDGHKEGGWCVAGQKCLLLW